MSPSTDNFIHSLVEMSKAFEELPGVKAELGRTQGELNQARDIIQSRELRIIERDAEIEALNAKVRAAEEARDQAETMFLECDDKLSAFRRLAESFSRDSASLVRASEPEQVTQPEPAPNAQPIDNPSHDYDPVAMPSSAVFSGDPANVDSVSVAPGEREVDPTASSPTTQASPDSSSQTVSVEPSVSSQTPIGADHGPYHGKLYIKVPGWVSLSDWLAGGGTVETYDWREDQPLPSVKGGYFWRRVHDNTIQFEEDVPF